ncbi:hypothetical protein KM043_014645 [Ampulex compressa]|nr:hypothetical protein KM043_014645 [Ampulex compressa]
MQDLCPLCLRNGAKNTVKPIQINLQEAVWMCESEKCVWPFGYKELIFVPRVVGKAWSCYWADDKMTNSRIRENILTSSESLANQQSLTRISDAPKVFKTASRLDHDVEQNIDIMSMRNVNVKIEYESQPLEMTFPYEELDATQYNVAQSQQNGDKYNASNEKVYNSSTNCFDKSDLSYLFSGNSNVTNVPEVDNDRKFPVITNVEKTNINVKMDDSNSFDKDILNNIKKEDIALTVTKSELDNEKFETENFNERNLISSVLDNKQCLDQKYSKYIVDSTKIEIDTSQQINITKMEVDGLPPITLTYETPACTTIDVKPMSVRKTESSETETTSMVNHPAVANGKLSICNVFNDSKDL